MGLNHLELEFQLGMSHYVGASIQTSILQKSIQYSELLSQLSSAYLGKQNKLKKRTKKSKINKDSQESPLQ